MSLARAGAFSAAVVALAMSAPGPGSAATAASAVADSCQARELQTPADAESAWIIGTDPTGRWLAGGTGTGQRYEAVIWDRGVPTVLDLPLRFAGLQAINRNGVAVGWGLGDAGPVAFAYDDGHYVELGVPPGTLSPVVTGISTAGVVSGAIELTAGGSEAVVWSLDRPGSPTVLAVPGSIGRAVGISPHGRVAVTAGTGQGTRSFLFDPQGHRSRLGGLQDRSSIEVAAVANGWAAGTESGPQGSYLVRYHLRSDTIEKVVIRGFEFTMALNRDGIIGGRDGHGALLYTDRLIHLPPLEGALDTGTARAIDNAGDAAGSMSETFDALTPAWWRCT